MDIEIKQEVLKEMKGSDHYSKQKHSAFLNLNTTLQQCPPKQVKNGSQNKSNDTEL